MAVDTLLKIEHLSKSYGGNPVLTDLSLSLPAGRIQGIVGENGAGKSTLVKCLLGVVAPDGGRMTGALDRIAAIYQEFNLANHLTVAENIFLGREPTRFGLLDRKKMRRAAAIQLARLRKTIDPDAVVGELAISDKQAVEIAKALACDCRVLVMDEPSTMLNRDETAVLFGIMREFRASGGSILYISHRLSEVKEICDDIAVLRDGVLISNDPAGAVDVFELARRMVGREMNQMFPPKTAARRAEPALKVTGLRAGPRVRGVDLLLHRGEILGLAGLESAGRTELAEALYGLRKITAGEVELLGRKVNFRSPSEALAAGLSYLADDRKERGVLLDFSVAENITLQNLNRYRKRGLLDFAAMAERARLYIERFHLTPPDPVGRVGNLSGGNQQKTAIAKGLDSGPGVFIFNEPTRGVDIAARHDIYEFIHELAAAGVGILVISSDLEELIGLCRRVLVMREGRMAGELVDEAVTEEEIMYLATGLK